MTQEEKAKRYDEAIKRAKDALKDGTISSNTIAYFEDIFPELAESEDERIRKELITHCRNIRCVTEEGAEGIAKWIAWLEKQGEIIKEWGDLKVRYIQDDLQEMVELKQKAEQGEQKPADTKEYDFHGIKFIPKFAKGDIIKDKKCGEVSTIENFSYDTGLYTHTYGQFPITIQDNYEIIAQKPAWSKEDESRITVICTYLQDYARLSGSESRTIRINEYCDWLKSLRPQNTWKPSDEQIDALKDAIADAVSSIQKNMLNSLYTDLKKL